MHRTIPEYNKTCHELKGSRGKGTAQAQCLRGKERIKKVVLQLEILEGRTSR